MNKDMLAPYTAFPPATFGNVVLRKPAPAYNKAVLLLIACFTLMRLALACVVELGNDEAYYWLYTRYLQWNYFDHPPLVGVWGWLFTGGGLLGQGELAVRLGSIAGAAIATCCLYRATATLYNEQAGWYAAVLYNTSLYAGIVAGLLIMPDSPQMICWTFSLWMFARIAIGGNTWRNWLLFGLGAGLCIMSKVHGVFLWGGVGLYILLHQRHWLAQPKVYGAALITALVASPILFWNLDYDFVTYRFHSERVVVKGWVLNWQSFFEEIWGQVFFNNPVNVVLSITALVRFRKHMRRWWPRFSFLVYMALPLIVVLLYLSLFRTVYPHWSGPAYVSLLPLSATWLVRFSKKAQWFTKWLKAAVVAALLFMAGWPVLLYYFPGTWGSKDVVALGNDDVSLDRYGWAAAGKVFAQYYRKEVAAGRIQSGTPLVCATWWGAHVEYYFARPAAAPMIGLGTLQQTHHYLWTNVIRKPVTDFSQAFCIVPSDEYYDPAVAFGPYYHNVAPLVKVTLRRGGKVARHFYVYKLSGWRKRLPVPPPIKEDREWMAEAAAAAGKALRKSQER